MSGENAEHSASLEALVDTLLQADGSDAGEDIGREQALALAELQKASTWALRAIVTRARQRGVSWRELAALLEMPPMTLHRQYRSGRGVVVAGHNPSGEAAKAAPPSADTVERLARAVVQPLPSELAPPADCHLPLPADRFVGRERELADLRPLLAKARLVTLTGPGGVGKTRLALEFLSKVRSSYGDGIHWVDLAPLSDGALVAPAVAVAMYHGRLPSGALEDVLDEAQHSEDVLLVLDNCEHVVGGCAELVERLLVRRPWLRVLATSREALRIPGEHVFALAPLPVSRAGPGQSAAVQLFIDRARASAPSCTPTDAEIASIAEVCRQLDGLPLAIELAARQAAVLSPERLLQQQNRRLDLLVGGLRTAPHRHQSLRSAINWSYHLLDSGQQQVFRRLCLLPGGFDEALAEAMCADLAATQRGVWPILTDLVAKSLLVADASVPGRFRILESLRIFGTECLDTAGERGEVQARLLAWAAELAEGLLLWTENRETLGHIDTERHNLHYAVATAEESGDPRLPLLGAALALCWTRRGDHQLTLRLAERLLTTHSTSSLGRACLCSVLALGYCMQGCPTEALAIAQEAIDLAQTWQQPELTVRALAALSRARSGIGEHDAAVEAEQRRVSILRTLGRPYPLASALNDLAWASMMADRPDEAQRHIEESLDLLEEDSAPEALGTTLHTAGTIALSKRRYEQATLYFTMSLSRSTADPDTTLYNLEGLAITAIAADAAERGMRLISAANGARAKNHVTAAPWWTAMLDRFADQARSRLGAAESAAALTAGAELNQEEAVRYALHSAHDTTSDEDELSLLTRREQQVAECVAEGLTDQQIASRLHISPRTVVSHLVKIRTKLGLPTRVHVATWMAVEGTRADPVRKTDEPEETS